MKYLLALSLFLTILNAEPTLIKETLAVLPVTGKNVSEQELQTITDFFITDIMKTDSFLVIEPPTVNDSLKKNKIDGSCQHSSCFFEVGTILGVQYLLQGTLFKLGETVWYEVKVFDVNQKKMAVSERVSAISIDEMGRVLTPYATYLAQQIKLKQIKLTDKNPTKPSTSPQNYARTQLKRKKNSLMRWGVVSAGAGVLIGTIGISSYLEYRDMQEDYKKSKDPIELQNLRDKLEDQGQIAVNWSSFFSFSFLALGGGLIGRSLSLKAEDVSLKFQINPELLACSLSYQF